MIVELPFAGHRYLAREILKEAGDAVVLEPDDARQAVLEAAEVLAGAVKRADGCLSRRAFAPREAGRPLHTLPTSCGRRGRRPRLRVPRTRPSSSSQVSCQASFGP